MKTMISTVEQLQELLQSPERFRDFIGEEAARHWGNVTEEQLEGVVRRVIDRVPASRLVIGEDTGNASLAPAPTFMHASGSKWTNYYNPLAAGAALDDKRFKGVADYLLSVFNTRNSAPDQRLIRNAALAEAQGVSGGFLVPEEFNAEIRALQLEQSRFRPLATRIPMTSMSLRMPIIQDTSHVESVFGGITAFWEPEAGTLQESEPEFAQMMLLARKLTAYTVASNQVLEDGAVGLQALISQRFPQAISWFEEQAFWTGTGNGMPLGILNADALIKVARQTNDHVEYQDVLNMDAQLLPSSDENAVWFAHPKLKTEIYKLAVNVGTGGAPLFVQPFGSDATKRPPATLFGRPIYWTEHLPFLGTLGDLVLVDLSYYMIGDRQDLAMESSMHVKFTNDQTVWRLIERLDGRPWINSALTLHDGTFQVSPFIALDVA